MEGNGTKSLKCDEECARLERNRKLALALNVDPENRPDDHIPYQAETLHMYLETPGWAQIQEKELRAFAMDPDVKRMRFKPMKPKERKFVHSLAEDFGFDSESMDPEPHRHIALFKTPRFVSAPTKTLAECARIRQIQRAMSAQVVAESSKPKPKASNVVGDPFNAYLVTHTRFGLTVENLRSAIAPILANANMHLEISFLPSEEIVLVPSNITTTTIPNSQALETSLSALKPSLAKCVAGPPFLGRLQLCRIVDSLNIERRESDSATSGWSQVAKAAAAPRRAAPPEGGLKASRNNFAVFETAVARKKKAVRRESVDEDWEMAEEREAEKEKEISKGASAVNSGDEGSVRVGLEGKRA